MNGFQLVISVERRPVIRRSMWIISHVMVMEVLAIQTKTQLLRTIQTLQTHKTEGDKVEVKKKRTKMVQNYTAENTSQSIIDDLWYVSQIWNTSINLTELEATPAVNITALQDYWYCAKWTSAQQDLFQTANLCFCFAFLIPKSFKQNILIVRAMAVAAFAMMALWGGTEICAPDVLAWNMVLAFVNAVHTALLCVRFLPPALSLELTDLYLKMFKPLKVSKKHFQELTKESRFVKLEPGEAYAIEEVTPADERLAILIKGKLRVTCDDTLLHYIQPMQFVDSPEWEANREQSDGVFQVSIIAEESSVCVCWPRMRLERVLRHRPMLKIVVDSLIGKDITHKLYSLNEFSGADANTKTKNKKVFPPVSRSASVDAVNETARGKLRSISWKPKSGYKPVENESETNWKPMVARQFPTKSPFATKAPQDRKFVTQLSSASLQPTPSHRRSISRKASSFRKPREVKFVEPHSKEFSRESSECSSDWSQSKAAA